MKAIPARILLPPAILLLSAAGPRAAPLGTAFKFQDGLLDDGSPFGGTPPSFDGGLRSYESEIPV